MHGIAASHQQDAKVRIAASAPGRICLFGEHQDYLGLPVVAAAIDVRCHIESSSREDRMVHVQLEDLGTALCFDLDAYISAISFLILSKMFAVFLNSFASPPDIANGL